MVIMCCNRRKIITEIPDFHNEPVYLSYHAAPQLTVFLTDYSTYIAHATPEDHLKLINQILYHKCIINVRTLENCLCVMRNVMLPAELIKLMTYMSILNWCIDVNITFPNSKDIDISHIIVSHSRFSGMSFLQHFTVTTLAVQDSEPLPEELYRTVTTLHIDTSTITDVALAKFQNVRAVHGAPLNLRWLITRQVKYRPSSERRIPDQLTSHSTIHGQSTNSVSQLSGEQTHQSYKLASQITEITCGTITDNELVHMTSLEKLRTNPAVTLSFPDMYTHEPPMYRTLLHLDATTSRVTHAQEHPMHRTLLHLDATKSRVTDVTLGRFTELQTLSCRSLTLSHLSLTTACETLTQLTLSDSNVTDEILSRFISLTHLSLESTDMVTLSFIHTSPISATLEHLSVPSLNIDMTVLRRMNRLTYLDISRTKSPLGLTLGPKKEYSIHLNRSDRVDRSIHPNGSDRSDRVDRSVYPIHRTLRTLIANNSKIVDDDLSSFINLEMLQCSGSVGVTLSFLDVKSPLTRTLRYLDISATLGLSDETYHYENIALFCQLRTLNVSMTAADLSFLPDGHVLFYSLTNLDCDMSRVTDATKRKFRRLH